MAQLDDLNNEVDTVAADEAKIKTEISTVLAELTALQGTSSPDLSGAITKLQALHAALGADDAALVAAEPAAPAAVADATGDSSTAAPEPPAAA